MPAATKKEAKARVVSLAVEGRVRDGAMYLRTEHATGEVEQDGVTWKMEYAVTMNGTPLVTLQRKDADAQWTTYSLPTEAIMRAVCDLHFASPPTSGATTET